MKIKLGPGCWGLSVLLDSVLRAIPAGNFGIVQLRRHVPLCSAVLTGHGFGMAASQQVWAPLLVQGMAES